MRLAPLAAFVAALVVACTQQTAEETGTEIATATCDKLGACEFRFDPDSEIRDVATCRESFTKSLRSKQLDGKRSACSRAELDACLAAIRDAECAGFQSDLFVSERFPDACAGC